MTTAAKTSPSGPSSDDGGSIRVTEGISKIEGTEVEYRDVHRVYGSVHALDGLNLRIEPGEMLALLGPSGCGKTTALRMLAGFDQPTTGSVLVGGQDISRVPVNKRDMGMVFQSYSLFPTMKAHRQRRLRAAAAQAVRRPTQGPRAANCSSWSGSARTPTSTRTRCPAASSSAWPWPGPWPSRRGCCCWTSRCRRWTRRCVSSCARRSAASSSSSASPRCSSPTTRKRRSRWPTGSGSCAWASSSSAPLRPVCTTARATAFVAEFVGSMNQLDGIVEADGKVRIGRQVLPADGAGPPGRQLGAGARPSRGGGGQPRRPGRRGGDRVDVPGLVLAVAAAAHRRRRRCWPMCSPTGAASSRPAMRVSFGLLERPVLLAAEDELASWPGQLNDGDVGRAIASRRR